MTDENTNECDCTVCDIDSEDFWKGLNCVLDMLSKVYEIIVHTHNVEAHNATVMALQTLTEWAHDQMNGEERTIH